jgi:ADP-ribose pyrophosphatase
VSTPPSPTPDDPPPFAPFGVHEIADVYRSHWCALRRDTVILPSGKLQEYHVFEIPDAIVVLPVLKDGSMVLIGQYRYPHGKTHWEIPAGRISPGEHPRDAALRELREEAGCIPGKLVELPGFYPTNGISPHYVHAFAALDCEFDNQLALDDSEQILAKRFSRDEVRALLRAGKLADAFAALTLLYYFELLDAPTRDPSTPRPC